MMIGRSNGIEVWLRDLIRQVQLNMPPVVAVCLLVLLGIVGVVGLPSEAAASGPELSAFQEQAIEAIREITLQLVLIAMGVFALGGGFVSTSARAFSCRALLTLSFICFMASVALGLLAYGNLIADLQKDHFQAFGLIATLARTQWVLFGAGGIFFVWFILANAGHGGSSGGQGE